MACTWRNLLVAMGLWLCFAPLCLSQQALNLGFEARETFFQAGQATGPVTVQSHRITEEIYHSGQRSEELKISLAKPSYVPYFIDIGKAPVTEELAIGSWIRANRPGIQILCRVVLPKERDPANPDRALTAVLPGDTYQLTNRWQQLSLRQPTKKLKEQQQILQLEAKRELSIVDAYVDRILVNVGVGPGNVEVWFDDLEAGPLSEAKSPVGLAANGGSPSTAVPGSIARRISEVKVRGNHLEVGGQKFFLRGVRYTGTPLKTLRDAGFNTLWLDAATPQGLLDDAVTQGFWLVPGLGPIATETVSGTGETPGTLTSSNNLTNGQVNGALLSKKMGRFLEQDAVIGWDLGTNLAMEKVPQTVRLAQSYKNADPNRPVFVDVADGFGRFAKGIDQVLLGAHRFPLGTTLELPGYRDWLMQKRNLSLDGVYTWTWIQAQPPEWTAASFHQEAGTSADPAGPSPEQIRLLAYTAIASGIKGLGYWSDGALSDAQAGRDKLLQMALLNQEFQLLEPVLLAAEKPYWIETSHPDVKAAVLRSEKSILVLPIWMGRGAQCAVPQGALAELAMVIPAIPAGHQAWEVSPHQVRSIPWKRVTGGYKIVFKEFNLTGAVVFTSDLSPTGLVVRFQDLQRKMVPTAAQWAVDLAGISIDRTARIYADIEAQGRGQPDGQALITKAKSYWESGRSHFNSGNHQEAYAESMRAMRPLRILQRACWDHALMEFDNVVGAPGLSGFYSLPGHYKWLASTGGLKSGENLLQGGDFELTGTQSPQGWMTQRDIPLEDVLPTIQRTRSAKHTGNQSLELKLDAKDQNNPPAALERAFLAIHTPDLKLAPGSWVKLSAWLNVQQKIVGSVDGALFYDSASGEPLAFRTTQTQGWRKVTLYRQVPVSGRIRAVVALTGMGSVLVDDITIEPVLANLAKPNIPANTRTQLGNNP